MVIAPLIQQHPSAEQAIREAFALGQQTPPAGASSFAWTKIAGPMWVPGEPVPQPRVKAMRMGSGKKQIIRMYTPDPKGKVAGWKSAIECFTLKHRPAAPLDCEIRIDIDLYCPRPKSLMRRADPDGPVLNKTKPDRDNYEKLILDAMTNAGWWTDDGRVCAGPTTKLYHAKTGSPGALITVFVLADEQQDLFGGGAGVS